MPATLESTSDATLRLFLSRIRTHDLMAFLHHCSPDATARILGLLSPRSAEFMRTAHWDADTPERVARAEALLEKCAAESHPCIFCAILAGKSPASFLYRDTNIAAFMDLYPVTPGHLLIIPVVHAESLSDVSPTVTAAIMELAQRLGRAVSTSDLGCDGFNLFMANGGAAGQDVFHAHLHILPRFHGDGFGFRFPGHYPQEAERDLLDQQAEHLRALLES